MTRINFVLSIYFGKRCQLAAIILLIIMVSIIFSPRIAKTTSSPYGDSAVSDETRSGLIPSSIKPSSHLSSNPKILTQGKEIYNRRCAPCHGTAGDGSGEAAYLLYPKPRDFTRSEYRLVSTWDGIPTDQDLYQTISRGMPGSSMPSWSHLPEEDRWALVHYVKNFSKHAMEILPDYDPEEKEELGEGHLIIPSPPEYTKEMEKHARQLYTKGCAPCHGETGRGDGVKKQEDSSGYPAQPRDLIAGVYKGIPAPEEVYKRIVLGLPGSPMPSSSYLHGDDGWALTHFILSLSSAQQREKMEMHRYRIIAERTDKLPDHPHAGEWRHVQPVELHLMPLWWRPGRTATLTVKALHDGNEIAILLQWADDTNNQTVIRPQDFRDAAAVQFSTRDDPQFFAMGEVDQQLSIWMWKSDKQTDLDLGFQDVEYVYPNQGIDTYPNLQRSTLDQPFRNAPTVESDPAFITAWGAGNIVANPEPEKAVESLQANGFGTLRAGPSVDRTVKAQGDYSIGSYQVVFQKTMNLSGSENEVLQAGDTISIAFAIWDGSIGDRDGNKSVTIWQEMYIQP